MNIELNRRNFIKKSAIGIAVTSAAAGMVRLIAMPPDMKLPHPYPVIPNKKPDISQPSSNTIFFNKHQYDMIATLAAIIIPTDKLPGATEANVADYIDRLTAQSKKRQNEYTQGLSVINELSKSKYGKEFLLLKIKEQIELLHSIDKAAAMRKRPVSNFIEHFDRKVDQLWDDLFGVGKGIKFFEMIRNHVFYGYYSNPVILKVIGYYGPPQPNGYLDYADPPSPSNYTDPIRPIDNKSCQHCHFDQTRKENHKKSFECTACHLSTTSWHTFLRKDGEND